MTEPRRLGPPCPTCGNPPPGHFQWCTEHDPEQVRRQCPRCNDTGNAATGYQHVGYDELGCPQCNEPEGQRCCTAITDPNDRARCASCGHPIEPTEGASR